MKKIILLFCFIISFASFAQVKNENPHISYVYPAGAKQGETINVIVAGQYLRMVKKVDFLYDDIEFEFITKTQNNPKINADKRKTIANKVKLIWQKGLSNYSDKDKKALKQIEEYLFKGLLKKKEYKKMLTEKYLCSNCNSEGCLGCGMTKKNTPQTPLLFELDEKSPRELIHIKSMLTDFQKKMQPNRQLNEIMIFKVKVAKDAKLGNREFRIHTKNGLTNPIIFRIGKFDEVNEMEPNNNHQQKEIYNFNKQESLKIPITINGQIYPGDVDRFQFNAEKGAKLLIDTKARSLIPYLADSVPGWFQPVITIFDDKNKELSYIDDYGVYPDPITQFIPPYTGKYEIEIKDSIYRGREDFIYRISISETKFIKNIFPLGGQSGTDVTVYKNYLNGTQEKMQLDTTTKKLNDNETVIKHLNENIPYEISNLPECIEVEPNNNFKNAMKVEMPIIINGLSNKAGDFDIFKINGKAGDKIVAEVTARYLNSQFDSFVRLIDSSGKEIAWNDDYIQKDKFLHKDTNGLITHHADSYLMAELPADGEYYIQLYDTQSHGGDDFAYRLRISHAMPSYKLLVTPSSFSMKSNGNFPITVHAIKKDGFDEDIKFNVKNRGFQIKNNIIPKGTDSFRFLLKSPEKSKNNLVELKFEGSSVSNGKTITSTAIPADDVMQAFLFRHLLPRKSTMVSLLQNTHSPNVKLLTKTPVLLSSNSTVKIEIKVPKGIKEKDFILEFDNPPKGFSIKNIKLNNGIVSFDLITDKDMKSNKKIGNLILTGFRKQIPINRKTRKKGKEKIVSLGVYIPISYKLNNL